MEKTQVYKLFRRKIEIYGKTAICFTMLFVSLTMTVGAALPQNSRDSITIDVQNWTYKELLKEIQRQSGINFAYDEKILSLYGPRSLRVTRQSLESTLDALFKGTELAYSIDGNTVTVYRKAPQAKGKTIKGKVTDTQGNPLPGVAVVIMGTSLGTVTNAEGVYSLNVPDGTRQILFTMLGMKSRSVDVADKTEINVVLEEELQEMDEVVVTGIFNNKPRESYTGSVQTVTKEELKAFKGQNLLRTLGNIDPAFNIMENNSFGSNPNRVPEITLRGSSSLPSSIEEINTAESNNVNAPLIIMDGFEITLEKLMDYNDEEIESINILKDASATAIYGSRGANGVVVIVTKAPQAGKLRVFAQAGFTAEMPDLSSYDLMNAREILELENSDAVNLYRSEHPGHNINYQKMYYKRLKAVEEGVNTDWLSKPVHTGIGQNYNMRVEGGSEEFRWSASLGYKDIQGAMKGSYRKNLNAGITLSYNYKSLLFRNQSMVTSNKQMESPYGIFSDYAKQKPYNAPYDENGNIVRKFDGFYPGYASVANPLYEATLNSKNEAGYTEIVNNFSIEWTVMQGLLVRGQFGLTWNNNTRDDYVSPESTTFESTESLRKGTYKYMTGRKNNYDASLTVSYSKTFADKHSVYVGLDYSLSASKSYSYSFEMEGYSADLPFIGNATSYSENGKPVTTDSKTRRVGFTGNVNYTYDNRYYLDASVRADGSSQFGSNKRFAPFYSVGIGWNLHREDFLKSGEFFTTLRLRLAYGQTGSQQFSSYQALSTYEYYSDKIYGTSGGAYLKALGNKNLKWQVTDQYNVGLDFAVWNSRIRGSFDGYIKRTDNLLSSMDLPLAAGFSSYVANIGEVENKGCEVSLNGYVIRDMEREIVLMVSGKLAYNKNKIINLSGDIKNKMESYMTGDDVADINTLFYEGRSQNSLYGVRSLGIDPSSGREIFLDRKGMPTYTWNAADKVYLGINEPLYRGNAGVMFSWKDLSVNMSFAFHWGGKQYNSTLVEKVEVTPSQIMASNMDRRVFTDRWMQAGDVKFFKGFDNIGTNATSRFVMNDRVLQLQTISLQYDWKSDAIRRLGLQTVSFSVNMSDLFYISSIKRERGTEYPFARAMGASVSLMF